MKTEEIFNDEEKCEKLCKKLAEENVITSEKRFNEIFEKLFGVECDTFKVRKRNSARSIRKINKVGIAVKEGLVFYRHSNSLSKKIEWICVPADPTWKLEH